MNILFSCAGRRRYLLKYFRDVLQDNDKIIATDMQQSAPALTEADIVEIVPAVYAENYIEILQKICIKHKVNAIISLNDLELPILAKNKYEFEKIGTKIIVSNSNVIDICFDKYKTFQFIEQIGLSSPKTFITYNDAIDAIKNGVLNFPIIVKPRWGSGSIGIEIANDMEELLLAYNFVRKNLNKTILANASISEKNIIIQEFINGIEYGLDIMNDLDANFCSVSVKQKLTMRAGETDKATTIKNTELEKIASTISSNLKHIANLDCDIFEQNGKYFVLELNPRFGGGYPFSHEAGVNMPLAIINWLKGEQIDKTLLIPKENMTFAKCDILVNVSQ